MVLVRVFRVTSAQDPETGVPGKQIELVEIRRRAQSSPFGDEARVVKNILVQFQSMGLVPPMREAAFPKMTIFLTENEYDLLGVRLDVNEVYELTMKDGSFNLRKATEGI